MDTTASVRVNLIANLAGRAWTVIVRVVFVPIYLHYLGVEAFALIGIHTTLTGVLAVLDLGLSATLTRELARLSLDENRQEARDLARTLEIIYWTVGMVVAVGIASASGWIATRWLHAQGLTPSTVQVALVTMAAVIGLQWPTSLYTGGLLGLQRHAELNGITAAAVTVQNVGAALVLRFGSPTIIAYFLWQIVSGGILVGALWWHMWRQLSQHREVGHVRFSLLATRWRFAGGMSGIALNSTILSYGDKVLLSRLLPLTEFGYYTFAFSVVTILSHIAVPVYTAVYPRLVQFAAQSDESASASLYHVASQIVSVLLVPVAVLMVAFPRELLVLYTGNAVLADRAAPLLRLLAVGVGLNGIMLLPLALQLANGWTSLTFWKSVVAGLLYGPVLVLLIHRYAAAGAALAFIALNASYVLIEIPLMHRRLLRSEMLRWYWGDVGRPLVVTAAVALAARILSTTVSSQWFLVYLPIVATAFLVAAVGAAPMPARLVAAHVRQRLQ